MPPESPKPRLRPASSENERFLRKLVDTDPTNYDWKLSDRHKRCKGDHLYQMCLGEKEADRIAAWSRQCLGHNGGKCPTMYSSVASEMQDYYRLELKNFSFVQKLVAQLNRAAVTLKTGLVTLEEADPVHPNAAAKLRKKMDDVRNIVEALDCSALRDYRGVNAETPPTNATTKSTRRNPAGDTVARRKADKTSQPRGKNAEAPETPKGKGKAPALPTLIVGAAVRSRLNSCGTDDAINIERAPVVLWPMGGVGDDNGTLSDFVHAVMYMGANQPPRQWALYVPRRSYFEFAKYEIAAHGEFLVYSTYSQEYNDARAPLNLRHRGNYLIYRREASLPADCPGLTLWEAEADESARAAQEREVAAEKMSPVETPSPRRSARTASTNAIASSSKRVAERSPSNSDRRVRARRSQVGSSSI
ncbi:hypothetical protein FB451DRAFT_1193980 [Mycena latifolia]|nr:hypothetical protein FB451DRAFT_1193980 [Mycena latifolia]